MGVPYTLLDVPYGDDDAAVAYLADQLRALADTLAKEFGTPFDENKLREAIHRENETRALLLEFFDLFATHAYPSEMITQLYLMMGVHLMMGTKEFLDVVRGMNEEIRSYPEFTGKKLLWIHLLPFYQETLNSYFNASGKYEVLAGDIVLDYMEEMDEAHPFEALAKKMLHNVFNGTYDRKAEAVAELVNRTHADGVIHFCHWGCKQASGGSILLKEKMQQMGVPMLILDGDGVDRRNSHDGQIRTRLEAFLELLDAGAEK
ncbi:MAG: 2-hydroxyacyl-CoA dehydratase family protein [Lachnospiraceae bacterium]|nr:2-hydroxyacyl-CoA dehydratase family protein [Lachnospiraceae bacterium]